MSERSKPNNGMHPTRNSAALIIYGNGGRVMPGVMRLRIPLEGESSMFVRSLITITALSLSLPLFAHAPSPESIYTDLSPARCRTTKVDKETGSSVQRCPGVGGHSLLVEDDDARQSVTVVMPDGKRHPLSYWQVVTTAFSTVGEKAEWRVERKGGKIVPIALIVRVYVNENPDAPDERTSYLAVAKITPGKVCVTEKIKGGATANEEARRAADASATKPCLQ